MPIKVRLRVIVGIMIFFGYFLLYIVRYNLSVHIVDMAKLPKRDAVKKKYYKNYTQIVRVLKFNTLKQAGNYFDIINWDDVKVAQLFAAYHIGYCVCFPIFHNFGDRLGPTWVAGIAGMISGLMNCLTPLSAYFDFYSLLFVRIIVGFCAGAMQPSMVQLLRHWVPPVERNHFMWAYCGITTGTFSTFLICAAIEYYSRWSVGFYISGGCQILWSVCWVVIVSDSPLHHSFISDEEKTYLSNTIGNIFTIKLMNYETPWNLVLKSIPFWALCILNFGYSWMIIAMCLHGPMYYSSIAEYSLYNASALTALPFFLRLVLGTIVIQAFHWYQHNTKIKRIKYIRKYFIVISLLFSSLVLVACPTVYLYIQITQPILIKIGKEPQIKAHVIPGLMVCLCWLTSVVPGPILLTTAVALTAAGMDLTLELCYELTPMYVNSVNTVIKIIGNSSGIMLSFCVGVITQRFKNSPYVWKHIWCFHALLLFLSGLIFLIWGETNVQPWNTVAKRPQRRMPPFAKPSAMSNIIEVEEDDSSNRTSTQTRMSSFVKSYKLRVFHGN